MEPKACYTLFTNMTNRGTKLFFHQIKYCWWKPDERVAVHCSLFAVNFSVADDFFFGEKVLCVRWWDCYPSANPAYNVRWKTCLQNIANAFYRLFAIHRFFIGSPLFRCCLGIVYSGLNDCRLWTEPRHFRYTLPSANRLNAFIFLCRTNPWVKYLRNSILFQILKEFYTDTK